MKFLNFASRDIGIDLGTSNILAILKGKGVILREPSVVAIDVKTGEIKATGSEAKEMIGKTPDQISTIKPLNRGVIADFIATQKLMKNIFKKIERKYKINKPRVIVGVPSGITEVEERAVEETIIQAGAKEVYFIEEPMSAAIGAGLNIAEPSGNIIVDIGGGTSEVAVISLGGIVISNSLRIAGDEWNENIISYIKKEKNLAIGTGVAEELKKEIGSALPLMSTLYKEIKGRDMTTGLPRVETITSEDIELALKDSLESLIETIKTTLEDTPPELASDIIQKGIFLSGGGAQLKNIDKLISEAVEIPVFVAEEPLDCVVKGTGKVLEDIERLHPVLRNSRRKR